MVANRDQIIGILSEDVFEPTTPAGSKATKFELFSFSTLIETICPHIWAKTMPKNAKRALLVDVRRSKMIFA